MLSFIINIIVWIFFIAFYGALWALIVGVPILWILGCFVSFSPATILVGIVSAVLAWLILKPIVTIFLWPITASAHDFIFGGNWMDLTMFGSM